MIRLLGLDPGLADTGYGIIEINDGKLSHLAHGSIRTASTLGTGERLLEIQQSVLKLIRRYRPEAAGIESLFFAKNITSAIPVAQARGVLLLTLQKAGIPAKEFAPQEIKMAISGSGRADKRQVQELVRRLVGLDEYPKPDHAADALAAAICCYHILQTEQRIAKVTHV
jgi:crossover junction endodeoxyribonuclease RuvC